MGGLGPLGGGKRGIGADGGVEWGGWGAGEA